jgi:mannose-6-phosphate isomerase-like protein (cupin superfamily)
MMRSRVLLALATLVFTQVAAAVAQAPPQKPPAQTPPPVGAAQVPPSPRPQTSVPARAPAAPAAARASIVLMVTDLSGKAVSDVQVAMTGPVSREGTTARDGGLALQALRAGSYRLRFESTDFITLERDVTVKAGPPVEVDVALDRAMVKPVAPPPAPASPAAPAGAPIPPDPNATVEFVALPDWIEKNLIGRNDPQKETSVGHTPLMTANVVQVRDPIKDRVRGDADEMLYVIAGEGVLRAKGREQTLDAGSLAVIPRGVGYTIERRGRNPLIALSIVEK